MPQHSITDIAAPASNQSDHAPSFDALARRKGSSLLGMVERTAHIGSWSMDLPGKQLTHSDEFAVVLGVTKGMPITPDQMAAQYKPEFRASILALIQNCSKTGAPFDEEMQIVAASKTRK